MSSDTTVIMMSINTALHFNDETRDGLLLNIDRGWFSNFIIVCNGVSDNFKDKCNNALIKRGLKKFCHHCVFRLPKEMSSDFYNRVAVDYDVTHVLDSNKSILHAISKDKWLKEIYTKHFNSHPWEEIKNWLYQTHPSCYKLYHKDEHSFAIIDTSKVASNTEQKLAK